MMRAMIKAIATNRTVSPPLYKLAHHFVRAAQNLNYDMARNGERWLLRNLPAVPVIFDVGANHGDWSREARRAQPDAAIHAFEIMPSTFEKLRVELDGKTTVNPFGLSNCDGDVELYVNPKSDGVTSMVRGGAEIHRNQTTMSKGRVTTGTAYMAAQGIDRIGLLKIDVEGAEHLVLKGFTDLSRIDVIQFEYGMHNIYARFLLIDFYALLGDFAVGKLYPDGVDFRPYHATEENFVGPNYVAVHRSRADLIARLARP